MSEAFVIGNVFFIVKNDLGGDFMTKQEAAVAEAYTGVVMLVGKDRKLMYEYTEKLLGFPIYTHEFPAYADKLKELSKKDFIDICKNLS